MYIPFGSVEVPVSRFMLTLALDQWLGSPCFFLVQCSSLWDKTASCLFSTTVATMALFLSALFLITCLILAPCVFPVSLMYTLISILTWNGVDNAVDAMWLSQSLDLCLISSLCETCLGNSSRSLIALSKFVL